MAFTISPDVDTFIAAANMEAMRTALSIANADVETYISTASDTVITTQGVAVIVLGTYTVVGTPKNFTTTAAGRHTYTGTPTVDLHVVASINAETVAGGGTKECGFFIAKNSTIISSSEIHNDLANNEHKATTVQALVSLSTGDYIEVFVDNEDDTTNLTINRMTVVIR